jgi:hypothetical protein
MSGMRFAKKKIKVWTEPFEECQMVSFVFIKGRPFGETQKEEFGIKKVEDRESTRHKSSLDFHTGQFPWYNFVVIRRDERGPIISPPSDLGSNTCQLSNLTSCPN